MAEQIIKTEYSDVMQKSYIDYAMSVICARALPDIRDGLKPVQRRVLYAMDELGLNYDKPHRKSARIVGDTMGKYHPHGDSSIYDCLVVLSQDFKKGMALVDGHGNFGSIEGDGAAAMRYTEAKLKKFTQEAYLSDLDKNVVDFMPNFDETEKEPVVLPVKVPNILINGAEGIAVGMTTSIPTHNVSDVIDAVIAYMKNENITTEEVMEHLKGPDFPTGGIVVNKSELIDIYKSGTGKIKVRGKVVFEPAKNKSEKDKLVITEIPYTMIGANIGKFISDVCDLVETKKTQDIVDISNESSKEGIRIVLELKKNADVKNLENMLYKKTKLEDTFGVNMLAIADGKPETLGVLSIIRHNVDFQFEINTRKYNTLLKREYEQKEIKEGLIKACNIIDLIIEILRGSNSLKEAKDCLINGNTEKIKFKSKESELYASQLCFTEKQAQAILDLRLSKLIGLEILALQKEYSDIVERIAVYEELLNSKKAMAKAIIKELEKFKKEYGTERRTVIMDAEAAVYEEAKFVEQEVVFIMDRFSYAKTVDLATYERNKETIHNEFKYIFTCMNTDKIYVFTDNGNLHQIKVMKVPFGKFRDKGTPLDNLGNYDSSGENIIYICPSNAIVGKKLLFTTRQGMMKLVDASQFDAAKKTIASTKLMADDKVVSVTVTDAVAAGSVEMMNDMATITGGFDDYDMSDTMGIDSAYDMTFDEFMDMNDSMIMGVSNVEPIDSENVAEEIAGSDSAEDILMTNEIVVLQTANGVFLRFPLREIPEKKKGAIGVKGMKLKENDYITNVYVMDAGDNEVVECKGKQVELRSLKTNKRGAAGTKKA